MSSQRQVKGGFSPVENKEVSPSKDNTSANSPLKIA